IPRNGVLCQTGIHYLSGLNDASYDLTHVNSEFTFNLRLLKNSVVLANRTGGGHTHVDFDFYQAQYLGVEDQLRGYRKYSVSARSKLYNNTELRIRVADFTTYLFPGSIGVFGFYDTGRIWADNDDSDRWLSGYGGGIWIAPLRRIVLTFTYAL